MPGCEIIPTAPFSAPRSSIEENRRKERVQVRVDRPQPAALSLQLMSDAPSIRAALLHSLQHPHLRFPDSTLLLSCCYRCAQGTLVLVHWRTSELFPTLPTSRPGSHALGQALRGLWALGDDPFPIATFAAEEASLIMTGPGTAIMKCFCDALACSAILEPRHAQIYSARTFCSLLTIRARPLNGC